MPLDADVATLASMQIFVEILGRPDEGRLMKLDVEARDSLDCVRAKINFEKAIPLPRNSVGGQPPHIGIQHPASVKTKLSDQTT